MTDIQTPMRLWTLVDKCFHFSWAYTYNGIELKDYIQYWVILCFLNHICFSSVSENPRPSLLYYCNTLNFLSFCAPLQQVLDLFLYPLHLCFPCLIFTPPWIFFFWPEIQRLEPLYTNVWRSAAKPVLSSVLAYLVLFQSAVLIFKMFPVTSIFATPFRSELSMHGCFKIHEHLRDLELFLVSNISPSSWSLLSYVLK